MSSSQVSRIALVGNPNTGKTTLFNQLTGLHQRTGNFPGCTVEKKSGRWQLPDREVEVIDLPGTYSLAAMSLDEQVVVDTLLQAGDQASSFGGIIVVADAGTLYRNLYLVHQLRELGLPMVVALNMIDRASDDGFAIDQELLGQALDCRVVGICAKDAQGLEPLGQAVQHMLNLAQAPSWEDVLPEVRAVARSIVQASQQGSEPHPSRHYGAFRALIDESSLAIDRLSDDLGERARAQLLQARAKLESEHGALIQLEAVRRYDWIQKTMAQAETRVAKPLSLSERLDRWLTHPVLGMAVLFSILLLVFQAIYSWAGPLMDGTEAGVGMLGHIVEAWVPEGVLHSLLKDGVIAGVGGVLVFLPQILLLILFFGILEDCGYMARAAFLMDRLFRQFGLSGQTLIPLVFKLCLRGARYYDHAHHT